VDVSDPIYNERQNLFTNPTNGSWWIVQIVSTDTRNSLLCASFLVLERSRKDLNPSTNFRWWDLQENSGLLPVEVI
jgi:hypothetical protein